MTEKIWDSVRRTLIITCGPLAAAAGKTLGQHMETRRGPLTAVQTLTIDEDWQEHDLATAVTQALTHISPPNLASLLATQEWLLQDEGDIYLTFLLDALPDKAERMAALMQQLAAIVYAHLGLEPATLLLWLVGDYAETDVADCLRTSIAASRGTAVLSLRNESGMRLPDEAALSQIAADLLWCLTATPLQTLPEQIQERCGNSFTGNNVLFTLGLHGWVWSPAAAHTVFGQRWLGDVLAYWTARADEPGLGDGAAVWLETQGLSGEAFSQHTLRQREQQPPAFMATHRKMPWPWELPGLWDKMQFTLTVDEEALTVYRKHACLRLADPLHEGTLLLQREAKSRLDGNPIAAISRTCIWLRAVMDECEQQIERTLDREETFTETMSMLIHERNAVEVKLQRGLQAWPAAGWSSWLRASLRFWRWPRLLWLYWQVQQALEQLSIILTQRAVLQRHMIQNKTARQGLSELIPILRRVTNQVEEVGEMFSALGRELANSPTTDEPPFTEQPPLLCLNTPSGLYGRLITDASTEAIAAATAIAGLGQQVRALDDTVEKPLLDFGGQRLAGIWQVGCAEALMALLSEEALHAHGRFAWEAACPLWRVDEARLDEGHRASDNRLTAVCGSHIQKFVGLLPDEDGLIWQMEAGDREHLWLMRVRAGLVLGE